MTLNTDAESATEEVLPSHVIVGVENCDSPPIYYSHLSSNFTVPDPFLFGHRAQKGDSGVMRG